MRSCPQLRSHKVLRALSVILCLITLSVPGWAGEFLLGEIAVTLAPAADIYAINARYGTTVKTQLPGSSRYLLKAIDAFKANDILAKMKNDKDILLAGANQSYQHGEVSQRSDAFIDQRSEAFVDSNLPTNFFGQKAVAPVRANDAQMLSFGGGVVVAVIDTGIDFNHPFFARHIYPRYYDFVDQDTLPQEVPGGAGYGHGTFVAGLIRLTAPGAWIMPLRAFRPDGSGSSFDIANAIYYAADNGAKIINMSFGFKTRDPFVEAAINYAYNKAFLVTAAGNDNVKGLHFPCIKNKTLIVAATDDKDKKANFSNYHLDVDVSAPGVQLYSTYPGRKYAWWSGTSFAVPLASGEAALLLQLNPRYTNTALITLITSTGVNIDAANPNYAKNLGKRIDCYNAVRRHFGWY
jgi:subtilisin family serine protease